VDQLKKRPLLVKIIKPVMTPEDFKSAFKCVPEKNASSLSGRGVHHYEACAEGLKDGLTDIILEVYDAIMTVPPETGYCPKRWRHAIDVMLEKIPGVSRSDKSRISNCLRQISIKYYVCHSQGTSQNWQSNMRASFVSISMDRLTRHA
jgi:hypothetical protein